MRSTSKKKTVWRYVLATAFVLIVIVAIPLPYKPSIWSVVHRARLNNHLKTFSAPVYVPDTGSTGSVSFETYLDWTNSYAIRGFGNAKSHEGAYFYYQLAKDGAYGPSGEGPSTSDMEVYTSAVAAVCEPAQEIEMCVAGEPKRYVLKRDVGEAYLLSEVTDIVFNRAKLDDPGRYPLPHDYLVPKEGVVTETAKILLSAKPVSLGAAKKFFKPEF